MAEYEGGFGGEVTASGKSLDEIIQHGTDQIRSFADGREFEVTQVDARPLMVYDGSVPLVWEAVIRFAGPAKRRR